jgi:hypothetical protein
MIEKKADNIKKTMSSNLTCSNQPKIQQFKFSSRKFYTPSRIAGKEPTPIILWKLQVTLSIQEIRGSTIKGAENNSYLALCPMLHHQKHAGTADIFTALYYTHLLYPNVLPTNFTCKMSQSTYTKNHAG